MKKMKHVDKAKIVFLAILMVALCHGSAKAQFTSYSNMLNTTMVASQSLFTAQTAVNKQRESMRVAAGQSPYGSTPAAQPPARQYAITTTDFRALSGPIMPDQFADSATGVTPEVREQMRAFFKQVLTAFEKDARQNNIASAFAFITAAALQVRNGKEPTNAEAVQLIAHFNNALANSPSYYTLNPRQQQMLYESLILTGGIIVFLDAQGKQLNNPQMRDKAMEMSKQVLRAYLGI